MPHAPMVSTAEMNAKGHIVKSFLTARYRPSTLAEILLRIFVALAHGLQRGR
jgi:hypothetical protein